MKKWSKKRIFCIWFLLFAILTVVIGSIPGTTYIDPETGENTVHGIVAVATMIISIVATYVIVRRHNEGKSLFRNGKFKQITDSEDDRNSFIYRKESFVAKSEEELINDAKNVILTTGQASVSMLQRKLGLGYSHAAMIMDTLEDQGFVGPFLGSQPREILFSGDYLQRKIATDNGIESVDGMEGHDFEYWCAELLKKTGFVNVEVTPGSGDQGVDILAQKDGIKYAIQCKCYSKDLGNTPIQEVEAGRIYYGCHVGVVMTNRHFTQGAKDLAQKTGTLLWDRNFLEEFLELKQKLVGISTPLPERENTAEPSEETKTIQITRKPKFIGCGADYQIFVDGTMTQKISNGETVSIQCALGKHTISLFNPGALNPKKPLGSVEITVNPSDEESEICVETKSLSSVSIKIVK